MTGLLRADLLRLRHRGDLWIGAIVVVALVALTYVTSASNANQAPYWPPENGPIPPEFLDQLARNRDPFTFPFSVITLLQTGGGFVAAVMVFISAAWLGTEFTWGTVRQLALLRPDRWRVVISRGAVSVALASVLLVVLVALGAVMPLIVPMAGSGHAPEVTPAAILAAAAGQWLSVVAAMAVALLFTVLTRSGALGIALSVAYFIADAALGGNPVWTSSEALLWVPRLLIGTRIRQLSVDIQVAFGPADPNGYLPPITKLTIDPLPGLAILFAWIAALVGLTCLVVRRADIRE
jgi:hypothetical protein